MRLFAYILLLILFQLHIHTFAQSICDYKTKVPYEMNRGRYKGSLLNIEKDELLS